MKLLLILLASAFATICWAESEKEGEYPSPVPLYCTTTCKDGQNCTFDEPSEEEKAKICEMGKAMDENGNCIPEDQCPHEECGENRIFSFSRDLAKVYCNGTVEARVMEDRCPCKSGYAINQDGQCVTYKDCNTVKCNENGKYTTSFAYVEKHCGKHEMWHMGDAELRCECKFGFVEDTSGDCVHLRQCKDDLKRADPGKECEGDYLLSTSDEPEPASRFEDIMFYFDAEKERCLGFLYLGCGGNVNNFYRLETCEGIFAEDLTEKQVVPTCPDGEGKLLMYEEKPYMDGSTSKNPNKPLLGRQCSDKFCPAGSTCHNDTQHGLSFCCEVVNEAANSQCLT